jgi:serine protease AprX
MLHKIDPNLLYSVNALNSQHAKAECIVYANNYNYTKNYLMKHLKFSDIAEYPFILAFGVKVDFNSLTELANLQEVSYITPNFKVSTMVNVSKKVVKLKEFPLHVQKKPKYTVAVIDTGISPIIDLCVPVNRIVHFEDFVNDMKVPYDDNGHGTFVTSVLAGNGLVSGKRYAGFDINCNIISLKALDNNGETGAITILKAMQWIYDHKKHYNIKVVCMSFGSGTVGKRDPLIVGAEVLWNAGITVVSAAGNSGPEEETIKSPGASNRIITVGALNDARNESGEFNEDNFTVADFSSRGPVLGNYKPDLIVSGVNITSACSYDLFKKHYKQMSGTSVATPMVAAVCSLLVSKNPHLSPNEIKTILVRNCTKLFNDRNAEGFGLLDCTKLFV